MVLAPRSGRKNLKSKVAAVLVASHRSPVERAGRLTITIKPEKYAVFFVSLATQRLDS
jgi:hypothetical protein